MPTGRPPLPRLTESIAVGLHKFRQRVVFTVRRIHSSLDTVMRYPQARRRSGLSRQARVTGGHVEEGRYEILVPVFSLSPVRPQAVRSGLHRPTCPRRMPQRRCRVAWARRVSPLTACVTEHRMQYPPHQIPGRPRVLLPPVSPRNRISAFEEVKLGLFAWKLHALPKSSVVGELLPALRPSWERSHVFRGAVHGLAPTCAFPRVDALNYVPVRLLPRTAEVDVEDDVTSLVQFYKGSAQPRSAP